MSIQPGAVSTLKLVAGLRQPVQTPPDETVRRHHHQRNQDGPHDRLRHKTLLFLEFGLGWARNNCGRPATRAPPSVSLSGTPETSWLASSSIAPNPFSHHSFWGHAECQKRQPQRHPSRGCSLPTMNRSLPTRLPSFSTRPASMRAPCTDRKSVV